MFSLTDSGVELRKNAVIWDEIYVLKVEIMALTLNWEPLEYKIVSQS